MNIKHLTLLLFLLSTINIIGQNEFRYGIKAGANFTGFHTENKTSLDNFGINIGGIAEIQLSELFSIQAELIYNRKGGLFNVNNASFTQFFTVDTQLDYIDVPIQGKLSFIKNLSLDVGPQIGFLIKDKGEIVSHENRNGENVKFRNINKIDLSLNCGLTYEFYDNLFMQARYNHGFTEIFDTWSDKNSAISLSVGYLFP